MKVIPIKGKYKGFTLDISKRILGTDVYKAYHDEVYIKQHAREAYSPCYIHSKELHGFDRIEARQSRWGKIKVKIAVKLIFVKIDILDTILVIKKIFNRS